MGKIQAVMVAVNFFDNIPGAGRLRGKTSWGRRSVGQEVSGAGRSGAELRRAGHHWGNIPGAGGQWAGRAISKNFQWGGGVRLQSALFAWGFWAPPDRVQGLGAEQLAGD